MQNFTELYGTINALLISAPTLFRDFQEIAKVTCKCLESPQTLCLLGYVNIKMIGICHWCSLKIALQYVIQNNYRKIWWCFLMISCIFWRSRKFLSNSPKLSCGFNPFITIREHWIFDKQTILWILSSMNLLGLKQNCNFYYFPSSLKASTWGWQW